jgi:hypothetical protein
LEEENPGAEEKLHFFKMVADGEKEETLKWENDFSRERQTERDDR